ncbi:MAG: FkbM family methyltransferase [Geminicoccaceae bacterium]|jgi:FkbM family methyltransferase|nr:FkbM family methyltransferase [Geminicoccaceae bacterium]
MFDFQPAVVRKILNRLLVLKRTRYQRAHGDPECALLRHLVAPAESSVDVGANRGIYTWSLGRLSRHVYAFEPNPELAALLRETFGKRVEVLACGLSDTEGTLTLWIPRRGGRELVGRSSMMREAIAEFELRSIEVPVRTLDSLGLDDVGFMKVHAEGHEFAILRGARQTLERCRPTLLVGAQSRFTQEDPDRIFAYLSKLGYGGYFFEHGRLRPFRCFDIKMHQRSETVLQAGQRAYNTDYIYNFIYLHPSRPTVPERLAGHWSGEPYEPPGSGGHSRRQTVAGIATAS